MSLIASRQLVAALVALVVLAAPTAANAPVLAPIKASMDTHVRSDMPTPPPPPPPPATYCDSAEVTGAWTGTGVTRTVTAGASIQAAVNAASPGDTVLLSDGNYGSQRVSITKRIRLKAASKHGAVLQGQSTEPSSATAGGSGTGVRLAGVGAAGAMVDGLYLRWHGTGIDVDATGPVTIQNNKIQSALRRGIQVWDARDPMIRCNLIYDPYLPNDPKAQTPTSTVGPTDAQTGYGLNFYGSMRPKAIHNYFNGVFNQTLSFKEGNLDPVASDNTFEGSKLTALFFGQNGPGNGPYSYTGLPRGPDQGTMVAERNVFRQVRDSRGVYYMRTPVRVWHIDGDVTLRGNVVESSEQGLGEVPECRVSGDAGCPTPGSTVRLEDNTVSGAVMMDGTRYQVNTTGCVLAVDSWTSSNQIPVAMVDQTCVSTPQIIQGFASMFTQTGTRTLQDPIPTLRTATPATDPDLSYQP